MPDTEVEKLRDLVRRSAVFVQMVEDQFGKDIERYSGVRATEDYSLCFDLNQCVIERYPGVRATEDYSLCFDLNQCVNKMIVEGK